MERGFGLLDTFLEDSTSFLSGKEVGKTREKKSRGETFRECLLRRNISL